MPDTVYALVDGNSFFASCEKVFRPDLRRKAVIVLSNNDGNVVARSSEAKALGIKMGQPFFQIREMCAKQDVAVFSSNYELYGDLSGRMMSAISTLVPRIEPYSIDECFADLSGMEDIEPDLTALGMRIKNRVLRWVGIPTCVGIAPTKTLAKYCNHLAKKYPGVKGVVNWFDLTRERRIKALSLLPISEIWGVGRRYEKRLNEMGIYTALDLARCSPEKIRARFNVVLAQTVTELRGIPCVAFEPQAPLRQNIMRSRGFGEKVIAKDDLCGALVYHAQEVGRVLRKEKTAARVVGIVLDTSYFVNESKQYHIATAAALPYFAYDDRIIIAAVRALLERYYRPGYLYHRAGVYASEIVPQSQIAPELFEPEEKRHNELVARVVDELNFKYGKGTVKYAGSLIGAKDWTMNREYLSRAYTTRYEEILRV